MTVLELRDKYSGQYIDWDGVYGSQCVDLIKKYFQGLGLPIPSGNANTYANNASDKVKWVANTPSGVPKQGDVVVWGTGIGAYGHVAIFIEGNTSLFWSLDQNFPLNSPVKSVQHDYKSVLGWLHPIQLDSPVTPPPTPVDPRDLKISELEKKIQILEGSITDLETAKSSLECIVASNKGIIDDLNAQLTAVKLEEKNLDINYTKLQLENTDLKKEIERLKSETVKDMTWGDIFNLIKKKLSKE